MIKPSSVWPSTTRLERPMVVKRDEFDPEKVRRWQSLTAPRDKRTVVDASDYDRLLALYREAIARKP
jgi:hypothetical protein